MANTEREIFARNLRLIFEKSHHTQAQVAAELGVSKGTMSDYVHARAYPRPQKLAQLCEILGVSQYDLTTEFYQEDGEFSPNRELLNIAKEIYNNPDARAIYTAIRGLDTEEIQIVRTLITKLAKKRKK